MKHKGSSNDSGGQKNEEKMKRGKVEGESSGDLLGSDGVRLIRKVVAVVVRKMKSKTRGWLQ